MFVTPMILCYPNQVKKAFDKFAFQMTDVNTMAIGVDSSKWKPRSLSGTPAARTGNIISATVLSVGLIIGAFYQFSGITTKFRKALDPFYEDPISEVERKQMIALGLPNRSGDKIRHLLEEECRVDLPDK